MPDEPDFEFPLGGRPCPDGHGRMKQERGMFALLGVNQISSPKAEGEEPGYVPNGKAITVHVLRCTVCGFISLYGNEGE